MRRCRSAGVFGLGRVRPWNGGTPDVGGRIGEVAGEGLFVA